MNFNIQITIKYSLFLLLIAILVLSCSEEPPMEPEIEMDNMSYPKVFGNAEIIVRQADIYS